MFKRLIDAEYPHSFLDTQYRMHSDLMKVPNTLFYDNSIQCGYSKNPEKCFLYALTPFLFIDVKDGVEKLKGTSFLNQKEVDVLSEFTQFVLDQFKEGQMLHDQLDWPIQKFTKSSIYVITPYNS